MVAEPVVPGIGILIYSWYCGIGTSSSDGFYSRSRDAETSAWRAHGTDDWSASTVIKQCDERSSVGTRWSRENNGKVGVETAPRGQESREARAVRTWQRLWRLGFHIQRIRGYARSCLSCLAENSETITNIGDGDSTTRTAVCNIAVPHHDPYTERSTESGEESWKQRFRNLQTTVPDVRNVRSGRHHGIIRANHDLQVRFQNCRRGRPSERISGTGETIRWGERYRSRSRSSEKGVHFFSNTAWASEDTSSVECWKTGNFNALRVATEDFLKSRRIFKTTSAGNTHTLKIQWKSMQRVIVTRENTVLRIAPHNFQLAGKSIKFHDGNRLSLARLYCWAHRRVTVGQCWRFVALILKGRAENLNKSRRQAREAGLQLLPQHGPNLWARLWPLHQCELTLWALLQPLPQRKFEDCVCLLRQQFSKCRSVLWSWGTDTKVAPTSSIICREVCAWKATLSSSCLGGFWLLELRESIFFEWVDGAFVQAMWLGDSFLYEISLAVGSVLERSRWPIDFSSGLPRLMRSCWVISLFAIYATSSLHYGVVHKWTSRPVQSSNRVYRGTFHPWLKLLLMCWGHDTRLIAFVLGRNLFVRNGDKLQAVSCTKSVTRGAWSACPSSWLTWRDPTARKIRLEHIQRRTLWAASYSSNKEFDAQRRNLGRVRVCTQVAKHVAARKPTRTTPPWFSLKEIRARDGPSKELCRTSAELLRHAVSCTCNELVDGAHAGEASPSVVQNALMVQRVISEQLAFTLQQVHQDWSRIPVLPRPRQRLLECHETDQAVVCRLPPEKVHGDEDLHEQNGQQLASELRKESLLSLRTTLEPEYAWWFVNVTSNKWGSSPTGWDYACYPARRSSWWIHKNAYGNSIPHHHEDHIAGKGENSLQHYNLVHKFIPMPQAMKIPAAKAAVDKEWETFEKISAWNLTRQK